MLTPINNLQLLHWVDMICQIGILSATTYTVLWRTMQKIVITLARQTVMSGNAKIWWGQHWHEASQSSLSASSFRCIQYNCRNTWQLN